MTLKELEKTGKIPAGVVAGYDKAIIDGEEGVGSGKKSIARAVNDAIAGIHGANPNPTNPSALPPAKAAELKEGENTTFGNGQVWTIKGGKPVKVK